ncbi:MAG: YfhO family protein [Clostridia bacterium]|nr:YfhO family protein [Clostridia bacterium]
MLKKIKYAYQDNTYIITAFFAAMVTMLIIYICNGMVPFGDKTILRMDLYHQYAPLFAELYERVIQGDSLIYSWSSGLGSCFLGNFFNYLSSPLSALIFFFGHKNITEAIAVMILLKASLSSAAFTYYAKKSIRYQSYATCAFGVLYAFCGYMLAYYWNVMWLDAMFLLPIVALGIERIVNHGKMRTYVIALSLSMFSNYYIAFMLCLFSVIYFFYYFGANYSSESIVNARFGKTRRGLIAGISNNRFLRTAFTFGIASLTAAGIMAIVLIPVYKILTGCSATTNIPPTELTSYFSYFDFFANHLASLETTIRSSGDDVLPNVYCGILTLILAPLFFFTKTITKKEKVATLSLLCILYFSFNLNIPNYIWHAFHFPNDLPYRQSFIYSFVLLVMAYKVFIRLEEFSTKVIGVVGAGLFAFVVLVDELTSKNVKSNSVLLSFLLIALFVVILSIFKDKRYRTASVAVLLLVCCCSEAVMCDTSTMNISVEKTPYVSDYDNFQVIKDSVDELENNEFYRMELSNLRTRMDPSWYYYNGASVFSSMAYEKLSNLQYYSGMMSNKINSYTYNPQTPVYNMMFSMKYIINNSIPDVHTNSPYYKAVSSYDKYTAYKNNYWLPIAYCTNLSLTEWATEEYYKDFQNSGENPFQLQGDYFDLATGGLGTPFVEIPVDDISYSNLEPFFDTKSFSQFYDKRSDELDASATYRLTAPTDGNIYIFYHVTGAESKNVTINTPTGVITQAATQNCIFDVGYLTQGQTVTVNIPVEAATGTIKFCAYSIDDKTFKKGYDLLSRHQLQVSKFEETEIEGSLVAPSDCLLYTSIPYDSGWKIYIDGKIVDDESIVKLSEALLAVKITKGNHNIRFKYTVPGFRIGLVLTLFTLLMITVYTLFSRILKKRKKKLKGIAPFPASYDTWHDDIFLPAPMNVTPVEIIESVNLNLIDKTAQAGAPVKEIIKPPLKNIQREIFSPERK